MMHTKRILLLCNIASSKTLLMCLRLYKKIYYVCRSEMAFPMKIVRNCLTFNFESRGLYVLKSMDLRYE